MPDETRFVEDAASPGSVDGDGFTRRQVVLGVAAAAAQAGLVGWPALGGAQPAAGSAAGTVDSALARQFLAFSKAITGHDDLDPVTAVRIREAMTRGDAAFAQHATALADLAGSDISPEALLEAAAGAGLRDAALAVVSAWYTGTVGEGPRATVVAYEQALMYRPVADGLSAPTYCNRGPVWWTEPPPEAGVPTPRQAAEPKPPPPPVSRSQ